MNVERAGALIRRPAVQVAALLVTLAALKLVVTLQTELRYVETYYWLYAQHPALGYFDHPGMIGWLVWLTTAAFGDAPWAVRLAPIACGALAAWFVFLAARRMYDERTARWAGMLMALAPLFVLHGYQTTPDAPLLCFWAATFWALSEALTRGRTRWWLAAGALAGLAMDSKYSAVFLAVGVLLFLVASPEHRVWLRRPQPYAAALAALAAFAPTLVWNAQHGWESVAYQSAGRLSEQLVFRWRHVREFVLDPVRMLTPVPFAWAMWAAGRTILRWRSAPWGDRLSAALGVPLLAFFAMVVFTRSVRENWQTPAWIALVTLAAAQVARGGRLGRLLHGLTLGTLGLGCGVLVIALAFVPRAERHGWAHVAAAVRERQPQFVLARGYHDASQIAYHLRPMVACDFTAVGRPSTSFRHWWRAEEMAGKDAIILWSGRYEEGIELVRAHFDSVGEPETVSQPRFMGAHQTYLIMRARGYRP